VNNLPLALPLAAKRRAAAMARCACLLMAAVAAAAQAPPSQQGSQAAPASSAAWQSPPNPPSKPSSEKDRRRAVKLYLAGSKLYQEGHFEQALDDYRKASQFDPTNNDYQLAVQVALSHAVTALLQTAAQSRTRGDRATARAALQQVLALDPGNAAAAERLRQLADDVAASNPALAPQDTGPALGGLEHLEPTPGVHSFHERASQRQVIQQVFRAWGIDAAVDDSIRGNVVRLDLDDASFADATRVVSMLTNSFYVAIDPHRALAARDTRDLRQQYTRNGVETVPLSGLTTTEMTDVGNMARNVFAIQQTSVDPTAATITLRAPEETLNAFNATLRDLTEGRGEVLIDVRVMQLAHTKERNTGFTPPQTITAFNVYAEEQAILNQNQALVQQIISSGLAAPGDTLAILGILLASGQVSGSIFSNGIVLFGGGIALSGISPGPVNFNLNVNSSDSRELDDFQLRLEDGEEGTLKSGTRYPIQTSSFSSLSASSLNIPGLTGAGTTGALGGLLASLQGASTNIPQVQYQDLGLVLKATPRVMRSGDVALNVDLKITALAGPSVNGVPVLANRAYSGVTTLRANEAIVIASEMDGNESRAVSGYPGMSEIPGLNDVTDKDTQKSDSTLLIIMTPQVVRHNHGLGHSPMLPVDRSLAR
jgi:general secretion pathway protein D